MKKNDCPIISLGKKAIETLTRSEKKRMAIIKGAWDVFLDKGFDVASMDQIAKVSCVSKRTVYTHFDSKEKLFEVLMLAICQGKRDQFLQQMDSHHSPKQVLSEFGIMFLDMLYETEAMSMFRILVGQTNQFPEIGTEFFRHGPQQTLDMVSAYFVEQTEKGTLNVENPTLAASSFIGSLMGGRYMQCLIAGTPPPDAAEIKLTADTATQHFLYGAMVGI